MDRASWKRLRSRLRRVNPTASGNMYELDCNLQLQSPLFSKIPPEVRNLIFSFVITQDEDPTRPYRSDAYYYRPGYQARRRMNTELLRTCQVVYHETKALPAAQYYEHTIWGGDEDRAPPDSSVDTLQGPAYHFSFPPGVRPRHVRFFAQMYWLENHKLSIDWQGSESFAPRKLSIVIRHTDWWWWESDRPLVMQDDWVRIYRCPNTVEELEIEFETVERKKDQLDAIIFHQVKDWKFRRQDRSSLLTDPKTIKVSRWVGSRKIEGSYFSESQDSEVLPYYVVTVTWFHPNLALKSFDGDAGKSLWAWKSSDKTNETSQVVE